MKYMEYKSKQPSEVSFIIDSKQAIKLKDDIYFEMICSEDGRTVAEDARAAGFGPWNLTNSMLHGQVQSETKKTPGDKSHSWI